MRRGTDETKRPTPASACPESVGDAVMKLFTIIAALNLSGCVVMTRRDFTWIRKAEHSIGYMEGLSKCAEMAQREGR